MADRWTIASIIAQLLGIFGFVIGAYNAYLARQKSIRDRVVLSLVAEFKWRKPRSLVNDSFVVVTTRPYTLEPITDLSQLKPGAVELVATVMNQTDHDIHVVGLYLWRKSVSKDEYDTINILPERKTVAKRDRINFTVPDWDMEPELRGWQGVGVETATGQRFPFTSPQFREQLVTYAHRMPEPK